MGLMYIHRETETAEGRHSSSKSQSRAVEIWVPSSESGKSSESASQNENQSSPFQSRTDCDHDQNGNLTVNLGSNRREYFHCLPEERHRIVNATVIARHDRRRTRPHGLDAVSSTKSRTTRTPAPDNDDG
jgi:hypothetical protein